MSANMLVPLVDHRIAAWVEFQRQQKLEQKKKQKTFTITISRMFGCEAYLLAEAKRVVMQSETKRDRFFARFLNSNIHNADNYHAIFNNEKCSIHGIASTIPHYINSLAKQ